MIPSRILVVTALGVVLTLASAGCGDETAPATTVDTVQADATAPASDVEPSAPDTDTPDTDSATPDAATAPDTAGPPDTSPLGGERPATVYLPADYTPSQPWPLAILLHGYSVTGAVQDLYLGFHGAANAAGLIAVVPDGTSDLTGARFWNASPAWCCNFANAPVDDAAYLLGLIAEASARYPVDPDRVYFVGHSNGGFMAFKMACEHADVVAGVVSIAGSTVLAPADCAPTRAVTTLQIHGTLDATIAYGGPAAQYPGAAAIADRWVAHNACDSTAVTSGGYDYDRVVLGAETTRAVWDRCADGVLTSLWTMTGSGHVPGFLPEFLPDVFAFLLSHRRDGP